MMHIRSQKVPVKYASGTYVAEDASVSSFVRKCPRELSLSSAGFHECRRAEDCVKLPFVVDVIASKPSQTHNYATPTSAAKTTTTSQFEQLYTYTTRIQ